jgi:putative transposase
LSGQDWARGAPSYAGSTPGPRLVNPPAKSRDRLVGADGLSPAHSALQRHRRDKGRMDDLMLELYYGGHSLAQAEEIARLLWGDAGTIERIGEKARKVAQLLELWLQRGLSVPQPYVYLQSIDVTQKVHGRTRSTTILAALGVGRSGAREILAVSAAGAANRDSWMRLVGDLKHRGLRRTELFIGPNNPALSDAVSGQFPGVRYQGDLNQLESEVLWMVPVAGMHPIVCAFAEIRATASAPDAAAAANGLVDALRLHGNFQAALLLEESFPTQVSYLGFPREHWPFLRGENLLCRPLHRARAWIRKGGPVLDDQGLRLMFAAQLRQHV